MRLDSMVDCGQTEGPSSCLELQIMCQAKHQHLPIYPLQPPSGWQLSFGLKKVKVLHKFESFSNRNINKSRPSGCGARGSRPQQ